MNEFLFQLYKIGTHLGVVIATILSSIIIMKFQIRQMKVKREKEEAKKKRRRNKEKTITKKK